MGMKEGSKIMGVGLLIIVIGLIIGGLMNSWTIIIIATVIGIITMMGGFRKFIGFS